MPFACAQSTRPQGLTQAQVVAITPSDAIDDSVWSEVRKRQVPGLSLAIIHDGKIVKAKGYGLTVKGGTIPVTPSTLFQAGSISKPVSALGALRLVGDGKDNSGMITRVMGAIARQYHWPDYPSFTPPNRPAVPVSEDQLVAFSGRYEFENNQMLTLVTGRGRLLTLVDGFPDEEFLPEADGRFYSTQRDAHVAFRRDDAGEIGGFLWREGGRDRKVPRIGPLFHAVKPQPDPDPSRTKKVVTALKVLGRGGKAIADSPLFTPGLRADFGAGGTARDLANMQSASTSGATEPKPATNTATRTPKWGRARYRLARKNATLT